MSRLRAGAFTGGGRAIGRTASEIAKAGASQVDDYLDEQQDAVDTMPWDEFLPYFRGVWKQGEHVMMVGPTGQGKTTLATAILPIRKYTVVFVTKSRDPLIKDLEKNEGYVRVDEFQGVPDMLPKQLLAPSLKKGKASMPHQRKVFENAMYQVFDAGHWCIYLDELRYVTDNLRLSQDVEFLLLQGRALKISLMAATQRPVKVPLEFFDQTTHLFFWRDNDEANRRRIGGIGGIDAGILWSEVARLQQYEFIYLNTRTGFVCKSKVKLTKGS